MRKRRNISAERFWVYSGSPLSACPFLPLLSACMGARNCYKTLVSLRRGIAQPGRAPALGAGGRGFESLCPDQCKSKT